MVCPFPCSARDAGTHGTRSGEPGVDSAHDKGAGPQTAPGRASCETSEGHSSPTVVSATRGSPVRVGVRVCAIVSEHGERWVCRMRHDSSFRELSDKMWSTSGKTVIRWRHATTASAEFLLSVPGPVLPRVSRGLANGNIVLSDLLSVCTSAYNSLSSAK